MQIKNISMNLKYYILNTLFNIHLGFIGATYVVYFYESGISKLTTNILLSIFFLKFQVSLKISWVMSLIFSLLYFISVCIFIEPQDITIKTKLTLKRKLFEFKCGYIDSINQFKANKNLEKIVLLNSTVAFVISPIFIFWSPYLKELSGNKIWILGNIWLIINLSNFIGNLIVEKKSIIRENYFLTLKIVYLILSVSIIIGVLIGNFISVLIAFIIFEIGLGIVQPLEKVLTNNFIEDSNRASLLSFDSMIQKIFNFGSLIIMGIISEYYSIKITWLVSSFMMVLIYYQINLIEKNLTNTKGGHHA